MARIRTIKPEYWKKERLAKTVSRDGRLLFVGLWNEADDYGRLRGHPAYIKGQLFPYDDDMDIGRCLDELERAGRILRYSVAGECFIWVRNFAEHQKMDKRAESKLPPPPAEKLVEPAQESAEPAEKRALEWNREQGAGKGTGSREAPPVPADSPPPKNENVPRVVEKPTTTPDAWTGRDFFAWAQFIRQKAKLIPEREPHGLGAWWNACLLTPGVTAEAMKRGFYAFGKDPFWEPKGFPFSAFRSQWEKYARREDDAHAA